MTIHYFRQQEQKPMKTPQELTETMLEVLLDTIHDLDRHLDAHPDSLSHVRWVAKEGDPGCCGAAVPVALLEKKVSKLKARIMSKRP